MASRWICLDDFEIDHVREMLKHYGGEKPGSVVLSILKKLDKAQTRIKTASAKGKGRELQQWVCRKIADLLKIPFDNQDDNCLIHSREMGQAGVDIVLRGDAAARFPFAIECKSTETMSMTEFIQQASKNIKPGQEWLIVYRSKTIRNPIAIMDWETLAKLYNDPGFVPGRL